MSENKKIEAGDIVYLKRGSPPMVVSEVHGYAVTEIWWGVEGRPDSGMFGFSSLTKVDPR